MTAVERAIEEIDASLAELEPELEGFRDYASLNIKPETKSQVQELIAQYERRVKMLHEAKDDLLALMSDGHPVIPIKEVSDAVYADMAENAATIEAALSKVSAAAKASKLALTAGKVEPK